MNMEIGTVARNSFSGNICFEFSVLCLCSVEGWKGEGVCGGDDNKSVDV
jgi:hypothetical protein